MSWVIDPSHSEINFTVRHMMISNVRGRFEKFTGLVDFNEDNPAQSSVDVQIETASVYTKDEKRDGHLRSADFFDAETYPVLTFKSTRVEKVDDHHGRIYGDLTLRDLSRQVVLDAEYNGQMKSPWGSTSAGFSATTKINRKDWGLTWNVGLETGGWLVGDEITINIELEIVKQAAPEAVAAAVAVAA